MLLNCAVWPAASTWPALTVPGICCCVCCNLLGCVCARGCMFAKNVVCTAVILLCVVVCGFVCGCVCVCVRAPGPTLAVAETHEGRGTCECGHDTRKRAAANHVSIGNINAGIRDAEILQIAKSSCFSRGVVAACATARQHLDAPNGSLKNLDIGDGKHSCRM